MAFIEDLSRQTYCAWAHEGRLCFSVGWLSGSVPRIGAIPSRLLRLLRHYAAKHPFEDGLLGTHTCEICGQGAFHGEFWIEFFDDAIDHRVRFVLPLGVFHYIEVHGYCPPKCFLDAIEPLARTLDAEEDAQRPS